MGKWKKKKSHLGRGKRRIRLIIFLALEKMQERLSQRSHVGRPSKMREASPAFTWQRGKKHYFEKCRSHRDKRDPVLFIKGKKRKNPHHSTLEGGRDEKKRDAKEGEYL